MTNPTGPSSGMKRVDRGSGWSNLAKACGSANRGKEKPDSPIIHLGFRLVLSADRADDADLEEVYNTERHLRYVACTRARGHLLVTSVDPARAV